MGKVRKAVSEDSEKIRESLIKADFQDAVINKTGLLRGAVHNIHERTGKQDKKTGYDLKGVYFLLKKSHPDSLRESISRLILGGRSFF